MRELAGAFRCGEASFLLCGIGLHFTDWNLDIFISIMTFCFARTIFWGIYLKELVSWLKLK